VQEVAAAEEQVGQLPWMPTIYLPTPQHSFVLKGLKAEVAAPALAPDLAPTFAPAFALAFVLTCIRSLSLFLPSFQ